LPTLPRGVRDFSSTFQPGTVARLVGHECDPIVSWRRTAVAERITALKSAKAAADAEEKAEAKHNELVTQNAELRTGYKRIEKELTEAREQVADTQRLIAEQQRQRHLTADQKASLEEFAAKFVGQKILVTYPVGDAEAGRYAGEFAELLQKARWDVHLMSNMNSDFSGMFAICSHTVMSGVKPPGSYYQLVETLLDLGLSDNRGQDPAKGGVNYADSIDEGGIGIRIGTKPPME
jgi:hypothetical protein